MDVRLTYDHYLVSLVADLGAAAGRLATVAPSKLHELRQVAVAAAARASARLDGSPLEPATAVAVDEGQWQPATGGLPAPSRGGWTAALRVDAMPTQDVAAVEYANLLAVRDAEADLAAALFDDPPATLTRLHGLICQGLVDPDVIGRPRRTQQAVHDGAQGMVVYNPPDPEALPRLLDGLARWLRGDGAEGSAVLPAPMVAAVVHQRLLEWQPYEAGNGRVARAAAALVLRARGLDSHGLTAPEVIWAAAPGAYYGEVAATMRRRGDLGVWAERHTETLLAAFHTALKVAFPAQERRPSDRAQRAFDILAPGEAVTVAEYAQRWNVSRETALKDLRELMVCGLVVREPRTLGRRFRRP